jgi:hypothetical protein
VNGQDRGDVAVSVAVGLFMVTLLVVAVAQLVLAVEGSQ